MPVVAMEGSSGFCTPEVPPADCCIFYGSNFFAQKHEETQLHNLFIQKPKGPSGALPNQGKGFSLRSSIDDMLWLVPQKQLLDWHAGNIKERAVHYAPLIRYISLLGGPLPAARFAILLTEASGVPILFNCRVPLTPAGNKLCKYGVVPTEAFIEDLQSWCHFYFAGRMHKPVHISWSPGAVAKAKVEEALHYNRLNALRLALLLLPEEVTFKKLLEEIVSLSYQGDIRMLIAEDPNKVQAIVRGQATELSAIYLPLLAQIPSVQLEVNEDPALYQALAHLDDPHHLTELLRGKTCPVASPGGSAAISLAIERGLLRVRQDRSPSALEALYTPLPVSFRQKTEATQTAGIARSIFSFLIARRSVSPSGDSPKGGTVKSASESLILPTAAAMRLGLQRLVFWPTVKCSFKNAMSAGMTNSLVYGLRKLGKRFGA